jgi:uncharacterized repeat protein (TIGR03803 family)
MKTKNLQSAVISLFFLLMLNACGGGSNTPATPPIVSGSIISGSITGLTGSSTVVLQNNSADKLSLSSNGTFTFASTIALNGSYAVTVNSQPSVQRCNITNGTGTNVQANVANVAVACVAATESVIYNFSGGATGGSGAIGELTLGADGNLYGVTSAGGASNKGTVFKLTPAGVVTVLHSFAGGATDGAIAMAGLTTGTDGNFYGVTNSGGTKGNGTFFKITPAGALTVLYSFVGGATDAASPRGALLLARDGNFYGMSFEGGTSNVGTVYKITPAGVETVLHSFAGTPTDGAYPTGSLNQGNDGNFYAVTQGGGAAQVGAAIKISPAGVETVLLSFANDAIDGVGPRGTLVTGSDGNYYGLTSGGGTKGFGTFFKITSTGVKTTLYSFAGAPSDGLEPTGTLIIGKDGNYYGTTGGGGSGSNGTMFMITPAGVETVLHAFNGYATNDGAELSAGLTFGADGYLYGVTVLGGTFSGGTIFKY